ncbi:lanthionine synthetase C family protein [Flavobacterium sediminilitoris]|uniref:Lanthionine synthetase C family protein n=1 Tax=Flavobacterium sediminilitoris TaxID=2024526 RepID=A0ABY4HKS5_9FLAO|nr:MULTISPECIES: lanthionine synthetase C family protein [Flavobacterium]UOX32911.1 lanthionine synthetase C family protein [Flavobacterium sediminilitoris]
MKDILEEKTKTIIDSIVNHNYNNMSLLSGNTGSLFLLSYYAEYTKNDKYLEIVEEIIVDTYTKINNGIYHIDFSYSNGITGFLWAINNLLESGHIDIDFDEYFSETIPDIYNFMMYKIEQGNYDFLHGALGPANFLLDITDKFPDCIFYLKKFNSKLIEKGIYNKSNDTLHFISSVFKANNETEKVINLSLSHGMAAIMYYFIRCLQKKELYSDQLVKALRQIINFYKIHQNPSPNEMSYFPSWIKLESHIAFNSRLAWCYGDLGIGTELYKASEVLKDNELKEYALTILKHTTTRRDLKIESVVDGNFCHGSCGLVDVYRTIYKMTNEPIFLETANYWLEKTIDLAVHEDGYAGYKTYLGGKNIYENNLSLLEGASGVAIVFLATLMDKELSWKKSLML